MKYIKKVIGVDISKDSFVIRFGTLEFNQQQKISKAFKFKNNKAGFNQLLKTINKINYFSSEEQTLEDIPVWFVMEATGVYYENLAYFLTENKFSISVILPNKIKHFAKTLEIKSKTDEIDAAIQTQFGLEKKLKPWSAPSITLRSLKELSREYHTINKSLTQIKNRLHAKNYSYKPTAETLKRINEQKKLLKKQLKQIREQIATIVKSDDQLYSKVKKIITTKGLQIITVVSVLGETNGFALIQNKNQLTSYAGFDIQQSQSGNYKGKTRISKKGNAYLRKAVYMPAISAARYNENLKNLYKRLCITKINKKIALVAVARKLLILIYTLWKKDQEFIVNYENVKTNLKNINISS
jgi:transposase